MGIPGLLKHLGSGKRTSLAALAAQHYAEHHRPLRLGIDIAIWLFQIQAGQGGSNPALRTFYYRILRLISLNIHPLFVFDGPNKPEFKRHKRVGGPGVRVASIPEFLAKQLLKQFGLPMHIAPGEAEAECALLQREGIIDGVLSEDVDTMMFGSTLTLRNWTAQGSSKTPTHVDLYDASAVESASGLDTHGMILVALMSGGDYIPEGVPCCGPKLAVDAARAGFGERLCSFKESDKAGLAQWREELQTEFRTNASKFFTRRNTKLVVPVDFPNFEVLRYYTNPCVSGQSKLDELRRTLRWDLPLDLPALRSFAGDAFDWHYRGGAIKFVRNLASMLLPRELRLLGEQFEAADELEQDARERRILTGLHGMRDHISMDMHTEMRVSYVPANLVPIDMSQEDIEPETTNDGRDDAGDEELFEMEAGQDEDVPQTPSRRKRMFRPYEEEQAERLWIHRDWVQLGCPTMLEDYEASLRAPKTAPAKRPARSAAKRAPKRVLDKGMRPNALMQHVKAVKGAALLQQASLAKPELADEVEVLDLASSPPVPALPFSTTQPKPTASTSAVSTSTTTTKLTTSIPAVQQARFRTLAALEPPKTPSRKKRPQESIATPQSGRSVITNFFSPSAAQRGGANHEVISLLSSSPTRAPESRGGATPEQRPRKSLKAGTRTLQEMPGNAAFGRTERPAPVKAPRRILQKSLSMPIAGAITTHEYDDCVEVLDLAEPHAQSYTSGSAAVFTEVRAGVGTAMRRPVSTVTSRVVTSIASAQSTASYLVKPESDSLVAYAKPLPSSQVAGKTQRHRSTIRIRESLEGSWTMDTTESLDLSTLKPGQSISEAVMPPPQRQGKTWRVSGVELLDLTDA